MWERRETMRETVAVVERAAASGASGARSERPKPRRCASGPARSEQRPSARGEGGVRTMVPLLGGVAEIVTLAALDVLPGGELHVEVVVAAPAAPAARGAVVIVCAEQPRAPPVLRLRARAAREALPVVAGGAHRGTLG